jgi:hypothetical protein
MAYVRVGSFRWAVAIWLGCSVFAIAGCGDAVESTSTASQASQAGEGGSEAETLPASAAGTSSESGPGLPYDFAGQVTTSLPLSPEDLVELAKLEALIAARNPPVQSRIDRGFGVPSSKARSRKPLEAKP